jgi:hypothetical protein
VEALLCALWNIVDVIEIVQRARMARMTRVNLLEELGGLTADLLKSQKSLRNVTRIVMSILLPRLDLVKQPNEPTLQKFCS